jgi:hypothetical protein
VKKETGINHKTEGYYFFWAVIQCSLVEIHHFEVTASIFWVEE